MIPDSITAIKSSFDSMQSNRIPLLFIVRKRCLLKIYIEFVLIYYYEIKMFYE